MGTGRYLAAGGAVLVLLAAGLALWAVSVEIAGAVVAEGVVVVASNVKKVQHPDGGVVDAILVRDGDRVKAGDLIVRLEDKALRSSFDLLTRQLDGQLMKAARLEAERDGRAELAVPEELRARAGEAAFARVHESETNLLESRRAVLDGQREELRKRILQLSEEGEGVARQIRAKEEQISFVLEEIEARRKLDEKEREGIQLEIRQVEVKELETAGRLLGLRREAARLEGELGRLKAEAAQIKGRVAEIELQIFRLANEVRRGVLIELSDARAKATELTERRIAMQDQLERLELRAPAAGRVHELSVASAGAVVGAGEVVALIVPDDEELVVEARIEPRDIDQVLAATQALVRFPAFDQKVTPEVSARLTHISADLARAGREARGYFVARVEIESAALSVIGGKKLVPGMPAEVMIATEAATPLSFLLKPLSDQVARAWKER